MLRFLSLFSLTVASSMSFAALLAWLSTLVRYRRCTYGELEHGQTIFIDTRVSI
ncbi:hypothetical protein REPUB_Repub08aG0179000 [Reevesia pubescens]